MTHDTFAEATDSTFRRGSDLELTPMPDPFRGLDLVELTVEIVAAYVAHNAVQVADLPALLRSVHGALAGLGKPVAAAPAFTPAVPVRKSVTDDYLISLEDGKRYQTLKRHLTGLGMTPAEYRTKWGLPLDYPMVAPGYAARRSALAKELGLGRKRRAG